MTAVTSAIGGGAVVQHALGREVAGEGAATAFHALDLEPPAMAVQRVLDDRQAEPGAARLARAARIHSIEALGEPRQMLRGDSGTGIAHGEVAAFLVGPPPDEYAAFRRRVFGRVVDEIRE